jgi:hypothetical protein
MAKKTKSPKELGLSCKDCRHSYDPHSKALDGHMILCRCEFFQYSKFLERDICDNKFSKK